jgi:hypothetical protein
MLDALDTSMACVCFFIGKLPPTTKGEVEDGRHIHTNTGKGQYKTPYPYLGLNLIVGVT